MTLRIKRRLGICLAAAILPLLSGCNITDPDWQARDNIATLQPSTPPPPQQWNFMGWGSSDKYTPVWDH